MRRFATVEEIEAAVGEPLGTTDWVEIDQARVDAFADLTGDHQWIHVDAERAAASPFGGTIVHGYLTQSMIPGFSTSLFAVEAGSARLNYGSEKVRFPSPLPTGSRIRASAEFTDVTPGPAGTRVTTRWTVEREGGDKPVCVAEVVTLVLP